MNPESQLPPSPRVDVGTLSRLLDDRVTSYKFFFFLSLLDRVSGRSSGKSDSIGDSPLPLRELAVDMVLAAWYPHGFCKLSLGYADMLQTTVDTVFDGVPVRGTWIVAGGEEWLQLRKWCSDRPEPSSVLKYVPYRLLSPFFEREIKGLPDTKKNRRIAQLAERLFSERKPIYCFTEDRTGIILNHDWLDYLQSNSAILQGWARFKLAEYLQSRNPNSPAVIEKLAPPVERVSLVPQTTYWREALTRLGSRARCIYSGQRLEVRNLSLDHFLPWSFVCHDRAWNLVPTSKAVNSSKSNHLPAQKYVRHLSEIHSEAIGAVRESWPDGRWRKAVEPYLSDLHLGPDGILDKERLRNAYESVILPLLSIAEKQGFPADWEYG